MKATIPEELTRDLPPTKWGKILTATPVVMTVVATLLAGLASSEMTTAQYDRALGAQLQSKAGDQWSYFQAKKLRGAMQKNSLELLEATTDVHPLGNPALEKAPAPPALKVDANVEAAMLAIEKQKPEADHPTLEEGGGRNPRSRIAISERQRARFRSRQSSRGSSRGSNRKIAAYRRQGRHA
jgi:hypothetical protein